MDHEMTEMLQSMQNSSGSIRVVSGSGFRYLVPFPWRLHQMLEEIETKGEEFTSIVSWLPDGLHFKVHDTKEFISRIVPQYFKQKSFKSFQRQLHIYGFQRITKGPLQGAFRHPKFIKGNRQLTHEIDRIKAPIARKNSKTPLPESSTTESPKARQDIIECLANIKTPCLGLEPSPIRNVDVIQKQRNDRSYDASSPVVFSPSLLLHIDEVCTIFGASQQDAAHPTRDSRLFAIDPSNHSSSHKASSTLFSHFLASSSKELSLVETPNLDSPILTSMPSGNQEASFTPSPETSVPTSPSSLG